MPLLALAFLTLQRGVDVTLRALVLADLLCSCAGDTALLQTSDPAFAAGSAFFALAHVAAIAAFVRVGASARSAVRRPLVWVLAAAWLAQLAILWPHLGALAVVVVPYGAVLFAMTAFALDTLGRIRSAVAFPIVAGALLFEFSDATIATARFTPARALPHAELFVIVAYLLAQSAIVFGLGRAASLTRDGARTSSLRTDARTTEANL